MNFFWYIYEWFATLIQNKMRSFLSLLGIVIGIASVIVLTAIGDGMKDEIMRNMITTQHIIKINRGKVYNYSEQNFNSMHEWNNEIGIEEEIKSERIFDLKTIELIEQVFHDSVKTVVPTMNFRTTNMPIINGQYAYADIRVAHNSYFRARDVQPERGTLFTKYQTDNNEPVAVIGWQVVAQNFVNQNSGFFGGMPSWLYITEVSWPSNRTASKTDNPIGSMITINNTNFRIIGILEKTDQWDIDNAIFIPYSTAKERFGTIRIENIEVHARDIGQMHELQKNLGYFLLKHIGSDFPSEAGFHLETNEQLLKMINEQMAQMSLFVTSIAAISLLVGGIGIMNIMLVSVTERTREIGIRKAIGARRIDIIIQFLTESSILSFTGGILAIIFSYLICLGISYFSPVATLMSLQTILFATGFSIIMGIVFGLMPAWKAAKMDAIEALRFE